MPSQYLMCLEVAISQRIHLQEGKKAVNRPCEISNVSPDRCEQEPGVLVALWRRADFVTAGTFLEHVCPAVSGPGRNSWGPGPGWRRRSIGERKNWLFPYGLTTVQGCWMLPKSTGVALGEPKRPCPPKCLENIVIFCFERRFSKQNSVIRLKSNISATPKFFVPQNSGLARSLSGSPGSHRQEMFCCDGSWHVCSWSHQHADS